MPSLRGLWSHGFHALNAATRAHGTKQNADLAAGVSQFILETAVQRREHVGEPRMAGWSADLADSPDG